MSILAKSIVLFVALAALLCAGPAATQVAPTALVEGYVIRGYNQPVPGLTVSMAHPFIGRSSPSITNPTGYYYFVNVPMRTDPYYIEVYWGTQLLFRNTVTVTGPRVTLPNIVLP
jgi:hypothetical protein